MVLSEYEPGAPFPGVIGRTTDVSSPAWPVTPRSAPGTPNVLMIGSPSPRTWAARTSSTKRSPSSPPPTLTRTSATTNPSSPPSQQDG
jgi:hypothetical protein